MDEVGIEVAQKVKILNTVRNLNSFYLQSTARALE